MGKKYIVEIGRLERLYKAFIDAHGKPEITWLSPEVDLTPYTEPDMEQVRKEAYDKGYENGFIAGHLKAEKSGQSFYEDGYKRGLADAWNAARKICDMKWTKRSEVFGIDVYADIIALPASECIEKIRQYEQEKEEQIQVGDEVISPNGKGVVTEITDIYVRIMYAKGSGQVIKSEDLTKTGRHFPEIAEILQKMKES